MRTGLVLPYMLGLDVISFSISMFLLFFCLFFFFNNKKKMGEKMRNFIFSLDSFSDIACVFVFA
jgi:predicted PurR-regulated permease PerM